MSLHRSCCSVAGIVGIVGIVVGAAELARADTVCPQGPTIRGIDVSSYEDSVDWDTARAAGIDFAFIRVGDGASYEDPRFASYWAGAKAAGVIRGAYQFFRPDQDPIAQADVVIAALGSLQPGDLPPVIDVEVADGRSKTQVVAAVRVWIDRIKGALGRQPIVYTGQYAWAQLTGAADFTESPLWLAQYTTATCPYLPAPWTRWSFWQTTDSGSVAGVPGMMLDLDVFDGSRADLLAFAGAMPEQPPPDPFDGSADDPPSMQEHGDAVGGCAVGGRPGWLTAVIALLALRRRRRA